MSNKETIIKRLDALGVPYARYDHPAAHTMEDCLALPFAAPDVTICKNILLCNRQQTAFYLYITPGSKPFRTGTVSKLLGSSRLSFAPEEALHSMMQVESGSLAPFGLWFSGNAPVSFAVDSDVRRTQRIAFHPCDNTTTVVFYQADFWSTVVPDFGTPPIFIDVPMPEMA